MGKAILVMDMPDSCDMCDFTEMVNGKFYCGIPGCGELAEDYIACRAEFCPLKPMPEKKMIEMVQEDYDGGYSHGFTHGFNACIDVICGKE